MPISPGMRRSPARESRGGSHKRGCSLESGIVLKERDDDLALFNEVQTKEKDNFLLQPNDDFEDIFVTKLRHFSDHKNGINVGARGESSDLLNGVEEKNDYEWLITPPETPLFASLDDEAPQVNTAQRGRPRAQPISISRSSTMEKSRRSSKGSPSPNRLSPSPRTHEPTFQPRNRATSAPSSSPPPTRRPAATGPRKPSSSPPPRASTPTSRRLSTGSITTTSKGISGNSVSPKVRAWQANIPGFSTEAPPNLRTSLADRPASYTRGSSPASRNGRKSKSPTASRNISSSYSKGSIASSADEDVESLPPITVDQSNSRRVSGFRNNNINNNNNKVPSPQKPNRPLSSTSVAPKRSFDMAIRQMDHRKSPQNMFRPLLSSVPTSSNFYGGKTSPAWNSSVTTSSNASSDLGNSGPHDIEENELMDDDATSGITKVPDSNVDDEVIFMFEKPNSVVYEDDLNGQDELVVCSRCGCEYSVVTETEDGIKICLNCQKSISSLTISGSSEAELTVSNKDNEFDSTVKPHLTEVKDTQHEELVNHDVISQPSLSYSETGGEQVDHTVDFPKSKVDSVTGEGISILLKRSSSIKGPVTRSGNFSASSMSYDALSYMSASSSVDFGPRLQSQRSSSRKSDMASYKHRRSVSSLSGTSSHVFQPSSVGTSTLDSFDVSVVRVERDVVDSVTSVGPQENPIDNDTCNENVDLLNEERDVADSASVGPQENDTCTENVDEEEPALFQKDEDLGKDFNALVTCTVEEVTSLTPEGEVDTCSSSPASQHSEELQDTHVSAAVSKDMAVSTMDFNTSNHSSSIVEESMVLVEGEGGTKVRSLTLEEATDAILFCSSIVHSLAYEAATIAMEKETPPEPSGSNDNWPLVPAVTNSHSGINDLRSRKTTKRSSKKMRRKTMEGDTVKAPNSINSGEETELAKTTRIVHPNNKENTKPPTLEAKCNCRIM